LSLDKLAARVGRRLKASALVLVTAESCTGGWVAQAVTAVAGSSGWFERGFVTYSNAAKVELLGVRRQTLVRHGAVSEQTAREMARGALARGRGSVALAVTGIAGPAGGTADKPVGTVCFAWARRGRLASASEHYRGNRASIRRRSVIRALQGVISLLEEKRRRG
jgi:nicotinamide-nucleotide amidase